MTGQRRSGGGGGGHFPPRVESRKVKFQEGGAPRFHSAESSVSFNKEITMKKGLITSVCALGLLVGASAVFAGGPGEAKEIEEGPAAPPPVVAEPEAPAVDYASNGFYLGAGGLYAIELFDNVGPGGGADNSSGFLVRGGYRLHPNAAVELLYENYHEFDTDPGHIAAWTLTGNVKAYFLTGRWQPYAVVGMGYFGGSSSNGNPAGAASSGDGFVIRAGAGMDAYITEHLSIGPELSYTAPFGSAEDLDSFRISGGLNYKF